MSGDLPPMTQSKPPLVGKWGLSVNLMNILKNIDIFTFVFLFKCACVTNVPSVLLIKFYIPDSTHCY